VEVDSREVASFDTASYVYRPDKLGKQLFEIPVRNLADTRRATARIFETDPQARDILRRGGEFDDEEALVDLEAVFSLPIDEALTSPSPLLQALSTDESVCRVGGNPLYLTVRRKVLAHYHEPIVDIGLHSIAL
jgi:hypothetical protein